MTDSQHITHDTSWAQRANEIVDHLPMGVLLWRLEDLNDIKSFRLLGANPSSSKAAGYPLNTLIGKTMPDAFPPLYDTPLPELYLKAIRTGELQVLSELHYGDEHVSKGIYTVKAIPLSDQCVIVLFENITEQKKMESALDGALQALLTDRKKRGR